MDICVLVLDKNLNETGHIRITNIGSPKIDVCKSSPTLEGNGHVTPDSRVEFCDGKECSARRIEDRLITLHPDLEREVNDLLRHSHLEIIHGPSREKLFDALRLRHECRRVRFTVNGPGKQPRELYVVVNSIRAEDTAGNWWMLDLNDEEDLSPSKNRIEARFNTTQRKGWMQYL
ncbi:MAG: hypothetical protein ACOZBH_00475 [Patescibacteria group bacterium]